MGDWTQPPGPLPLPKPSLDASEHTGLPVADSPNPLFGLPTPLHHRIPLRTSSILGHLPGLSALGVRTPAPFSRSLQKHRGSNMSVVSQLPLPPPSQQSPSSLALEVATTLNSSMFPPICPDSPGPGPDKPWKLGNTFPGNGTSHRCLRPGPSSPNVTQSSLLREEGSAQPSLWFPSSHHSPPGTGGCRIKRRLLCERRLKRGADDLGVDACGERSGDLAQRLHGDSSWRGLESQSPS